MGYRLRVIGYGLAALLLIGCGHQAPQRPSQRKGQTPQADSTQMALMSMNQQLAETADGLLYRWAQEQTEPYALYERGTWALIRSAGDSDLPIHAGDECTLHMQVYSLAGHKYCDVERTARVGKYELPPAIDENITEWHRGARIRMAAPWYAAYGIKGTADIPPYENVIIELDIR
jgi:hypothetical protein